MSIEMMAQVWKRSKVKGAHLLVLLALADYAGDDGTCWPSVRRLAEKARSTPRYTQELLRDLTNWGYVTVHMNAGPNRVNVYALSPEGGAKIAPLKSNGSSSGVKSALSERVNWGSPKPS